VVDATGRWSWPAIWRAAVSVSAFALPLGLLQNWLVDSGRIAEDGQVNYLLFGLILMCGVIGGFGAAALVDHRRLQHGAAAAALATVAIHATGALRRALTGDDGPGTGSWLVSVAFTALLMAICGMIGAALERRTRGLRPSRMVPKG
jgi:hypothetical protein